MSRLSRDEWALRIAREVASIADCTRSQVGAVILNPQHRIIGAGYNGLMAGIPGCASEGNCPRGKLSPGECAPDSDYGNCSARHAEFNAIDDALVWKHVPLAELEQSTLYCTRKPCPACQTLINSCGIRRVVVAGEEESCIHSVSPSG